MNTGTGGSFLHHDHRAVFGCQLQDLLFVQIRQVHKAQNRSLDPLPGQQLGSLQDIVQHHAVGDKGHIPALPMGNNAGFQPLPIRGGIAALGASGIANGNRAVIFRNCPPKHILLLGKAHRIEQQHSRHLAQKSHVKNAVMGRAVIPYQTCPVNSQDHMEPEHTDILHDLVVTPL